MVGLVLSSIMEVYLLGKSGLSSAGEMETGLMIDFTHAFPVGTLSLVGSTNVSKWMLMSETGTGSTSMNLLGTVVLGLKRTGVVGSGFANAAGMVVVFVNMTPTGPGAHVTSPFGWVMVGLGSV
jgi:hypothetical protein